MYDQSKADFMFAVLVMMTPVLLTIGYLVGSLVVRRSFRKRTRLQLQRDAETVWLSVRGRPGCHALINLGSSYRGSGVVDRVIQEALAHGGRDIE